MRAIAIKETTVRPAPPRPRPVSQAVTVQALAAEHQSEVLSFLTSRPLQTVFMTGLIRDNGISSPLNRGTFYGCRNAGGQLEGVALIGHAILLEARSEAALEGLARLARSHAAAHMILGEQVMIDGFWHHYGLGQSPRLACRELLFEQRWPVAVHEPVGDLRQATLQDLDLIVPVHAQLAFEESGVNPLEVDPEGFRARCARRIEQGRVWVWVEGGELIFKTDVVRDTPEVVYLEGIYVHPGYRGKGYGRRCLSQLGRRLLERTKSVCLLVNEQNQAARAMYERAGYKLRGTYDTLFLQQKGD